MILPILNGLLKFSKAPMTWLLFMLNAGVFFAGMLPAVRSQAVIDKLFDDENFMRVQGRTFSQFVTKHGDDYSASLKKIASMAIKGDQEKLQLMANLAVRNTDFMGEGYLEPFRGDQVEIKHWRSQIADLRNLQDHHPSYQFGITGDDLGIYKWITYIFIHSGPTHFLGNMYFLLIFGSMLEPVIGSLALLIVFLFSGMIAAAAFILVTGATAAPLIGASGAISGIMGLFCYYFRKTPVRYMYFVLPSANYTGLVYLPAWVVMVTFVLSDLAGYWGSVSEFGGIAYTAHLGGEATALVIGVIISMLRFRKTDGLVPETQGIPVGVPISITDMVDAVRRKSA